MQGGDDMKSTLTRCALLVAFLTTIAWPAGVRAQTPAAAEPVVVVSGNAS